MIRRLGVLAAILTVFALMSVMAVTAEKEKDAKEENPAKNEVDLSDLGTAFQLIEYGREHEAPEALIAAAGLLKNVSRAKVQDLEAKVEILDNSGKAVEDKTKADSAGKVDLAQESKDLFEEADILALKQKVNVAALVKAVKNRKLKDEPAVVKYYARELGGQQTLVIPVKVHGEQISNVAIRASEAVRVSVVRKDDKTTLAATLTTGGNLPFKANKGEATPRGVRIVKQVIKKKVEKKVVRKVEKRVNVRRRAIGDGDAEVTIRIHNPSKSDADIEVFLN